jgi:predicted dehydrogenase
MMRWITGSEVASVYATSTSTGYEKTGLIGAILTNLVFQNGVIATLENAWREITPETSKLLSIASFRVQGTRGYVEIRSDEQGVKISEQGVTRKPDTVNMPIIWGQIEGTYRHQTEYFVRCLREHKQTDIPLTEGLQGVVAAEGIMRSLQEKREIKLIEE